MERSGNFYKAIRLGYILISILIGCMAYNSLYEWQEIEALELGNKKIDELRKEINNINIQMIKFSLLGETILEWNDKDIEHYHARRMAMDSMLCRFKATYPAERIDSVRSLLEDKERQMFQIVRLMDEQQSINKKIANQIPVIVQKSVQEQSKKPKRKGFLGHLIDYRRIFSLIDIVEPFLPIGFQITLQVVSVVRAIQNIVINHKKYSEIMKKVFRKIQKGTTKMIERIKSLGEMETKQKCVVQRFEIIIPLHQKITTQYIASASFTCGFFSYRRLDKGFFATFFVRHHAH